MLYYFLSMPMGQWGHVCKPVPGAKYGNFEYCRGASVIGRGQRGA